MTNQEIFNRMELLRCELANLAAKLPTDGSCFGLNCLKQDIHNLRGRIMQVTPRTVNPGEWQNIRGSIHYLIAAK